MSLCVWGTRHLPMFRAGWQALSPPPGLAARFLTPDAPVPPAKAHVIAGLVPGLPRVLSLTARHGIVGEMENRPHLVPFTLLQEIWMQDLAATPLPALIARLRAADPAPILHLCAPLPFDPGLDPAPKDDLGYLWDLTLRLMAPVDDAVLHLRQPQASTHGGVLSRGRFRKAAGDDRGNAALGALWLKDILELLDLSQARCTSTDPTE